MNRAGLRRAVYFVSAAFVVFGWLIGFSDEEESVRIDLRIDDSVIGREEPSGLASFSAALKRIRPAVVNVYAEKRLEDEVLRELESYLDEDSGGGEFPVRGGVGSGVIVAPQGYILTNHHVIDGADRVVVELEGRQELVAEVIGSDRATDVAVLRIETGLKIEPAVLGNSDELEVGDVVFACGNALGIGHAVTSGIISAQRRTGIGILGDDGYEDFIQTDASMNIGNSGGPLIDSQGRVIGINTAIASPGNGNVGVGFAIPINMAREVMLSLIETGEVQRGYLGVTLRTPDSLPVEEYGSRNGGGSGVLVVRVDDGGPADLAGLEEGDFLVGLNGRTIEDASDLRLRVSRLKPGTEVALAVVRGGESLDVPAVLGRLQTEKEDGGAGELLPGLRVSPLDDQLRERMELDSEMEGLLVTGVSSDSPHGELFQIGSVVLEINQRPAVDLESARAAIREGENRFLIFYQNAYHYLIVEVSE